MKGKAAADTYSAAQDIANTKQGSPSIFLDSHGNLLDGPEYSDAIHWLHTHAHEYGFIVRFQPGKEAITGYQAEAWHLLIRRDKATAIYHSGFLSKNILELLAGYE